MDIKQGEKLERYLRNANRFLWGLGSGNQKETYEWLKTLGFNDNGSRFKSSYTDTTEKLIKHYGIERIMRDIIKKRVYEIFPAPFIVFLRNCWKTGVRPTVDMLKANGFVSILENSGLEIFLLYNKQFNFIEGWGQFAGVWFEEIEPSLNEPSQ
jgi:hypothetical protein